MDLGEWEPNMRDVSLGGNVAQAPDVLLFASHQTVMPPDALILTPARGTHWGENTLQFVVNGLTFTTKLGHKNWPQAIQQSVLNQTPNWIESCVHVWGEKEWRDMKRAANRLQRPHRPEAEVVSE